jgi:hypothetical protein
MYNLWGVAKAKSKWVAKPKKPHHQCGFFIFLKI